MKYEADWARAVPDGNKAGAASAGRSRERFCYQVGSLVKTEEAKVNEIKDS